MEDVLKLIFFMILLYNFAKIFRHNVDICFDCNESFERWDIDDFVINVFDLSGGNLKGISGIIRVVKRREAI
jgi:hypothetical protein